MRPGTYWNPAPFKAQVQNNAMVRMRRAMTILVAYAKVEIQELGTGVHSKPGEFPASQSNLLRTNITMDFDIGPTSVTGYFGVIPTSESEDAKGLMYALYLETGTKTEDGDVIMEPRPWLTLTLDAKMEEVKKILGAV